MPETSAMPPDAGHPPKAPSRPEVVIVDDDADSLSELEEFVGDIGYTCRAFTAPQEALAYLRGGTGPIVLLSDVRMPGMSGLELSRVVRDRDGEKRAIEIVLFSGHSGFSEAVEALKVGIVDFLIKPIDLRRLERTIAQACERLREHQAAQVRDERLHDFVADLVQNAQRMVAPVGGRRWCPRPNQPCKAVPPVSAPPPAKPSAEAPQGALEPQTTLALVKLLQTNRRTRDRLFPACASGDAAWEIILFVVEQHLLGRPVSLTSACHATAIPQSTALRKIDELIEGGQLYRTAADDDRRRVLVRATPDCEATVARYLEATQGQLAMMGKTLGR